LHALVFNRHTFKHFLRAVGF
ncbi:hypothetical protein D018_4873B, partial [Vibrio parahaemolyticus VP2007-007]